MRIRIFCLAAILLAGCASTPVDSGYLSNYERLGQGEYLERYWVDLDNIGTMRSTALALGYIQTGWISDKGGVTVDECVGWLKSALDSTGLIPINPEPDVVARLLKLDVAITVMDPGSAAKRIWAGELGAGHAQVQIEGKLIDVSDGNVVATFAERRSSSGAIGLNDIGGDSGPELVRRMIELISEDLTSELNVALRP